MSEREQVVALLNRIPDYKMGYMLAYVQGLLADEADEIPNAGTLEAIGEVERMIADGSGEHFTGSAADFFQSLAED